MWGADSVRELRNSAVIKLCQSSPFNTVNKFCMTVPVPSNRVKILPVHLITLLKLGINIQGWIPDQGGEFSLTVLSINTQYLKLSTSENRIFKNLFKKNKKKNIITHFKLFCLNFQHRVWRKPGHHLLSITPWVLQQYGVVFLAPVTETLLRESWMEDIFLKKLIRCTTELRSLSWRFTSQEDNDDKHTA